ncbi:hypothetical protein ABBQ38_006465 [Trebouxia sp. C0009 RCD-2024]
MGIRKCTANEVVLAAVGRLPLQIHFWRQILKYHHRTLGLDDTRLVTLAMLEGFAFSSQAVVAEDGSWPEWREHVMLFLMNQQRYVFGKFDIATVVDKVKQDYYEQFNTSD